MTASPARVRPTWRELGNAARTPRMLGLLALLAIAAVVCVRLGAWQIDRAFEQAEASRAAQELALAQTDAREMAEVLQPGEHVLGADVGVPVTVTGTYDPTTQFLVPGRVIEGESGYLVVTGLRTTEGVWLPVVRGFVSDADDADAAPEGEVTLLGSVGAGEAYYPQDLPDGQLAAVSPALFANTWGMPVYNAYLVLAQGDGEMMTVPRPQLEGGGDVDLRNLGYAIEWYVFGGFALLVWFRMVRDEAITRRLAGAGTEMDDDGDAPGAIDGADTVAGTADGARVAGGRERGPGRQS